VSVNNVAGSIKIQTKFSISQLKHQSSTFHQYINKERLHINSAQLGVEEGVTMGWCWKSHPAFGYRDEMKSRLKLMMCLIREMFMRYLDNKGNALFHSMEHTNNSDAYRLLFDETNTEQVDTLLGTIDESIDAMGDWDNADSHYRFHSHEKVNKVGIQPRGEQSDFWKKHFA
jgi:hypothetical protein